MSTQHWRGPTIPGPDDDLLGAWEAMLDTAGIITQVPSIAAARLLLTTAETAGRPPTSSRPAYFDIGGVVYRSIGAKNGSTWVLSPLSEREMVETPSTAAGEKTLDAGEVFIVATSTLPARPYDRVVEVDGSLYGAVLAGAVDLGIRIGTAKARYSRFQAGQNSVSLHLVGKIAAGVAPVITLVIMGGLAGSKIALSGSTAYQGLDVAAAPVTMGG